MNHVKNTSYQSVFNIQMFSSVMSPHASNLEKGIVPFQKKMTITVRVEELSSEILLS